MIFFFKSITVYLLETKDNFEKDSKKMNVIEWKYFACQRRVIRHGTVASDSLIAMVYFDDILMFCFYNEAKYISDFKNKNFNKQNRVSPVSCWWISCNTFTM